MLDAKLRNGAFTDVAGITPYKKAAKNSQN